MPNGNYTRLGFSCDTHTIACTSNHKFLPIDASVYKKRGDCLANLSRVPTDTLRYESKPKNSDIYSYSSNPSSVVNTHIDEVQPKPHVKYY